MTLPQGAAGVDTSRGMFLTSAYGFGDQSVADLVGNDQETVKAAYKNRYFRNDSVWSDDGGPLAEVWGGLRQGISMPMAIVEAIAKRILGLPPDFQFGSFDQLLSAIKQVPALGDLAEFLTGVEDGDLNDIGTWALNTRNQFQQIIDGIISGLTGQSSTGNDPGAIVYNLINAGLQLPAQVLQSLNALFGQNAATQAQVNALANGGFSHDWAANGVTGWTNLVGTLALRGNGIQASSLTVATRTGPAVDKYGVSITVDPTMRGSCRAAICATNAGAGGLALEAHRGFEGDALRLLFAATPTLAVVLAQADLIGPERLSGPTVLDLRTDGVSKFTVLRNGQPVSALDWVDATGIVVHDAAHRSVVLTSKPTDRSHVGSWGPAITGKAVAYAW